eukprot:COSAG01_NODE_656_length_14462_cov_20.440716_9_plen_123_part_00
MNSPALSHPTCRPPSVPPFTGIHRPRCMLQASSRFGDHTLVISTKKIIFATKKISWSCRTCHSMRCLRLSFSEETVSHAFTHDRFVDLHDVLNYIGSASSYTLKCACMLLMILLLCELSTEA